MADDNDFNLHPMTQDQKRIIDELEKIVSSSLREKINEKYQLLREPLSTFNYFKKFVLLLKCLKVEGQIDHHLYNIYLHPLIIIGQMAVNDWKPVLFPMDGYFEAKSRTKRFPNWFNKSLNVRQKSAIVNIVRGHCRPMPYILYGPPGTGKTETLVEAIRQVFATVQGSRILVCGVSNACADSIALKLSMAGINPAGHYPNMVRVIAFSKIASVPKELKYCTSLASDVLEWSKARIIVSTCNNVSAIVYNMDAREDVSISFTHTFIDEAGQCMEPQNLLAILQSMANNGVTVLAGDPKQLGPVVRAGVAANHGLTVTLMDRLLAMDPYLRHEFDYQEFGFYDPKCITKLIVSYRCCSEMIKINSDQFYDSEPWIGNY